MVVYYFNKEIMDILKTVLVPIHREGHIFIGAFALMSLFLGLVWEPLGWMGFVVTAWCVYFFRDPDRVTPQKEGLIVGPGDGVVSAIEEAPLPGELDMGDETRTRISIFLNIFNVHVNRVPVAGTITALEYHPGKFLNASLDKASEDNERQTCAVTTAKGDVVAFVQIAGLIARRIVCNLQEKQQVATGERFGIIRFGSRVDVYLPKGVNPLVVIGQQVVGGETVLADLTSKESARTGIKH